MNKTEVADWATLEDRKPAYALVGEVDLVVVGSDRIARNGDVCNKIGTYLKALAAHDNGVPFYVALPGPTIDWTVADGVAEIPIEERGAAEVTHISGALDDGRRAEVRLTPEGVSARNYAFDVTPARYVTAIVTERGIIIRMGVAEIRRIGRATQGVRLIRLDEGDHVVSLAKLVDGGEDDELLEVTPQSLRLRKRVLQASRRNPR